MKLTWKNTSKNISGKKRPAISPNPNLPFDNNQDDAVVDDQPTSTTASKIHSEGQSTSSSTSSSSYRTTLDNGSKVPSTSSSDSTLADQFLEQGNKLAEDGRFGEALGKWQSAIMLTPEKAILHEQKAQVLLELGDSWGALKAASRAAELEPSWAEAWITLGRAQLNFGEPDAAIDSFDKAFALKPDLKEARDDRQTALHLVERRKQLHSTGLSANEVRYMVGGESKSS